MKKIISILLSSILILSVCSISITTYAEETIEERDINNFVNGIVELSREYDAEKDFVPVNNENENEATATLFFSNGEATQQETDSLDFQTARLIVREDDSFNTYGAVEHIKGFKDFHILQYETPELAQEAYIELKNVVNEVEPDSVQYLFSSEDKYTKIEKPTGDYLTEWSVHRTQSKQLQEYYENIDTTGEVVVGIVDSGIDYNHEIFENRIVRSYSNSSPDGDSNDEMDIEVLPHGTMVASVIVDNSPDFVKVSCFRIASNEGEYTVSVGAAGILSAINAGVDVMNLSLGFREHSSLMEEAMIEACNQGIHVVCAVGNMSMMAQGTLPSSVQETISVSSTNSENIGSRFNTFTTDADLSAPGEEINVAAINNTYAVVNGTSFASPCVAALVAVIFYEHPDWTTYHIENLLKYTSIDIDCYEGYDTSYDGEGLVQFCNALNIKSLERPKSNLSSTAYTSSQICSFETEENIDILYTTDGTFPTKENAITYKEPFEIAEYTHLRAISYDVKNNNYSSELDLSIRIKNYEDESNFIINADGIVTDYLGNHTDIIIPEYISNIQVVGFKNIFAGCNIIGLTLPQSVKYSNTGGSKDTLRFIEGDGVTAISYRGLSDIPNLEYVNFPNLKVVNEQAFYNTPKLRKCDFPNLETVASQAFDGSYIINIYAPKVTVISYEAFVRCYAESINLPNCTDCNMGFLGTGMFGQAGALHNLSIPSLKLLPMYAFGSNHISEIDLPKVELIESDAFYRSSIKQVQFSNLITAESLPKIENSVVVLPSTFKECTEDTANRNYMVYGTSGTYAEEWAKEYGHEFVELSQETAILEDVPTEYYGLGEILSPDVVGFNKTYQWYSNTEPNNTTGTPIEGATNKEFNPADYPEAHYYYCVITSTDNGYNPIEIRTGITENKAIHIHTEEEIPAVSPNCTETGLTAGMKCSECGEIITEQQEIPALEHNYKSVVVAPTCAEQGYTTYTCKCGDTYVGDYVNVIGHTPANAVEENYIASTCTVKGSKDLVIYCLECGKEISRETVSIELTSHKDIHKDGICDNCDLKLCDHTCHKEGITGFFWRIINVFNMLLGLNKTCSCGVEHY